MAEGGRKSIDDIAGIFEMMEIVKLLDIPQEGLNTKEDMKEKVKEFFRQSDFEGNQSNWTTGFSVISKAINDDRRKMEMLNQIYIKTLSCVDKLDKKFISLLSCGIPNIKETILEQQRRLFSQEYYVLVSGETSAGKSSLLNLILGEDVLPYAVLNTTSTICELRYASDRKMVLHFKTKGPVIAKAKTIEEIPLKKPEDCDGKSYLEQISPYVHMEKDRESGSEYEKVEILWPHELLKNGVVIIDTPGIGESDEMDKIVMDYLPKAFAFMYVLNGTIAGGIQKDRIIRVFDEVRKRGTVEEQKCLAECALFICNKWDQVPAKENDTVKEHVTEQLKQCWPDVDADSQIVYLSTTNAKKISDYGVLHPEFVTLMKCIESMVLKAINARLNSQWVWLDRLLYRMSQQTTAFISNTENERQVVSERMDSITRRINEIQKKEKHVENDLKNQLNGKIEDVTSSLSKYLNDSQFKETFTTWTKSDAPPEEKTWELTKNEIKKAIESRLQKLLQKWEEEYQELANAHHSLVQSLLQRLNVIEEEVQKLEEDMVGDNREANLKPMDDKREISTGAKVLAGVTGPVWIPLGVVGLLVGIPVLGIISAGNSIKERIRLTQYRENRCVYLQKKSEKYLDSFSENGVNEYIKKQMKETATVLQEYIERIPRLIEADKRLAMELKCETRSKENVQSIYRPILKNISEIRELSCVFAFSIHHPTIDCCKLDWKDNKESCLGEGECSAVYRGTLKKTISVAIKLLKKSLDTTNMRIFCSEEQTLRKLEHANVVTFYGTASVLLGEESTVFVMELCQENLNNAIFNDTSKTPAQNYTPPALCRFCKWATQIADGLKYIHAEGLYHRHLNLKNILVSHDGMLKISDVGIRTHTLMTESIIVYYAPEVIQLQSYNASADLYSFGIILWEMWYGEKVFNEIAPIEMECLIEKIQDGYRPYTPTAVVSLPKLQGIMGKCWDPRRECRPTSCQCYIELEVLFQEIHVKE